MRIAVTGVRGQLAESLRERAGVAGDCEIVAVGRPEIDLSTAGDLVSPFAKLQPQLIVNAAAYTAVDKAEAEADLAFAINRDGARRVAEAAAALGLPLIHLSTDYVFSGAKSFPYTEDDEPQPRSVYGHSKLAGEAAVRTAQPRSTIVRTSWVYSPFGNNFVKTMLRLAPNGKDIRVVADQTGNPTSALDLADALLQVARRMIADRNVSGLFHVAGTGATSWYGLARYVFEVSREAGGPAATVIPITTAEYPTAAQRPRNSCLDCAKFERVFGFAMPSWRVSSQLCVSRLL
jgi:dTDP-4-dehydrorhamnose reductase